MGSVEFSDTVKIARGTIDMWDLIGRKRNGIRASTKKIRRLMKLTGIRTAFQESLEAILIKRKAAMSTYKKLKKTSTIEREKFGKRLIQARAKAKGTAL